MAVFKNLKLHQNLTIANIILEYGVRHKHMRAYGQTYNKTYTVAYIPNHSQITLLLGLPTLNLLHWQPRLGVKTFQIQKVQNSSHDYPFQSNDFDSDGSIY